MTLILSLITDELAMQVADRRLTYAEGPKAGELCDDDTNKLVCLCGNSCFAYTGLAQIGKLATDKWIGKILKGSACRQPAAAFDALCSGASDVLSSYRREIRRHAFVAVGWLSVPGNDDLRPFVCKMSNALDANGLWTANVEDKFVKRVRVLSCSERLFLTESGVPIGAERKSKLIRLLRRALSKNMSPSTVLDMLVQTILDVSRTDARVGTNLLCVTIPKKAVPANDGGYLIVATDPNRHQITFKYFNPAIDRFVQNGPDFICGNGGWTNFKGSAPRRPTPGKIR